MALLNDALMALRRNYQLVLAFLVVALLLSVGNKQLGQVLGLDQENLPPLAGLLGIVLSLATLAVYSATCAIIFARLGKDMDRPIWKCADDSEALRRYFEPWFLLNLVHYAIFRLAGAAENAGQTDLAVSIVLVACLYAVLIIPVGACIVYAHGLDWKNLGEILSPIGRQFGPVLVVVVLGFLQVTLFIAGVPYAAGDGPVIDPRLVAFEVAINLIDLFAFAVMWRILMIDRDTPRDDSDYFDF